MAEAWLFPMDNQVQAMSAAFELRERGYEGLDVRKMTADWYVTLRADADDFVEMGTFL
jgi:hypothetical protein